RDIILWDELEAIVAATTGLAYRRDDLAWLANATTEKTRAYNLREGLTADDDWLPDRFFDEKTAEGESLSRADLARMIEDYNAIRRSRAGQL
ncbi:MAG: aldehyde:ferredoxin oxidoreductase, partial [Candidatus Aminicenantes bacterium]|nr:aldehyde:ferredoxin oxidoreductase [Candidatus Aminicenantes bacterium]